MTFCINCGQELVEEAKFCVNCGKAVNNNTTHQRTPIYDGTLHKCLNCGELLNSFVTNCPSCGYELRNIKTESPINELAKKIEQTASVDEKIELITNFYVPNTKEDIFDFFILAISNLETNRLDTKDAWRAKLEQTYHKAKISFGNTSDFEYIEKLYSKTLSKISKSGVTNFIKNNKSLSINIFLITSGIIFIATGIVLIILLSDNEKGVGSILTLIGMALCFAPSLLPKEEKRITNKKTHRTNDFIVMKKGIEEFIGIHYQDATEQLKIIGFKNITLSPEKIELFRIENTVKSISIAGEDEFEENDEFDINSKVIIRYYAKNI